MLICPFYADMFVDYGLSGLEVSLLFAVWSWSGTCIALEVPSGALADRFSRKRATFAGLAFGALLLALGLVYTVWMVPLLIPRDR